MTGVNGFVIRFHAIFALKVAIALGKCLYQHHSATIAGNNGENACDDVGNTVSLLVAGWHLVIFFKGVRQYPRLLSYYRFLLPLSVLFLLPDWFLVKFTKTLYFPPNGSFWMIGDAISPCMAGMWSIPGLLILCAADDPTTTTTRGSEKQLTAFQYVKAAFTGLLIFGLSEQLLSFVWTRTEHVTSLIGWGEGVMIYVLPAEFLLGPTILYAYHATKDGETWWHPTIGAAMTMLVYTGALSLGLLAFEDSQVW